MPNQALPVGVPVSPQPELMRPQRRVFTGPTVTLVPLDADAHAGELFALGHGSPAADAIWTYMGYGPFADEQAMHVWLVAQAQTIDPLFFTVFDNASGQAAGMVSFLNIVPDHRRLELGHIWYGLAYQGTGVNAAAAHLMLAHTFDELRYRRAEWKCDALNWRSRAAALRLGFSYEGIFRQHMIVKGRNRDTAWFAMTDEDWGKMKAGRAQG